MLNRKWIPIAAGLALGGALPLPRFSARPWLGSRGPAAQEARPSGSAAERRRMIGERVDAPRIQTFQVGFGPSPALSPTGATGAGGGQPLQQPGSKVQPANANCPVCQVMAQGLGREISAPSAISDPVAQALSLKMILGTTIPLEALSLAQSQRIPFPQPAAQLPSNPQFQGAPAVESFSAKKIFSGAAPSFNPYSGESGGGALDFSFATDGGVAVPF